MNRHENLTREELFDRLRDLEEQNERLSVEIESLSQIIREKEKENNKCNDHWYKEKYAVKILDSLPDMVSVLSHTGVFVDLVSSEHSNHVGEPSVDLIGRDIATMVPEEAYKSISENLKIVLQTNQESTGRHTLTIDNCTRHYENRIFPLDDQNVLCMCRDITDSVNAQEELELVNLKMKLAEDIASLSHWYYYSDTHEFVAPGILPSLFGFKDTQARCNFDEYLSCVHPDDREQLRLHPLLETSGYREHRLFINGHIKYLHTRIIHVYRENGQRVIEGYVQDMTYIVDRIHELETVKYAVNNAVEEIYSCSLDGRIVFANHQFISRHQLKEPVSDYRIYELGLGGLNQDEWCDLVIDLKKKGGTLKYNVTQMSESRVLKTFEVMTYIIQDHNGEDVIWLFARDITVRTNQEDKIKELNYVMDAILNNIPVYLFVKDPGNDFRYLYWNKAFEEHSSIPASFVLGKTDFDIFPNRRDAEKFRNDDLYLLEKENRLEFQEVYITATGEERIVTTLKTLVPSENKLPLIIGVSWDITDLKNTEKELIAARVKAEQSDKLKSAFLANMSHEIRTPLNAIVGFSKLIVNTDEDAERQQYSDIIDNNAELLLQLINDILDISKIEAGTLEFFNKPVNLGELFRDVYEVHRVRVHENVSLICESGPMLIVSTDQNRLLQVVTNLITNAIKFTSVGTICFGYEQKQNVVEFYVKDTGSGIPQEKLESIFNRFIKLNNFAQGTGLGLSICKMIVEKLGGRIWVESQENVGSTFRFTIPCHMENMTKGVSHPDDVEKEVEKEVPKDLKTILVAEDIESNFLLLKATIGRKHNLVRARNGIEAIEQFKLINPDLILMDIKMPEMDGLEATCEIRKISLEIPIIALTAFAFEADKQEALNRGCNDFITKPVSLPVLQDMIRKYTGSTV